MSCKDIMRLEANTAALNAVLTRSVERWERRVTEHAAALTYLPQCLSIVPGSIWQTLSFSYTYPFSTTFHPKLFSSVK
jgi:hypothetical protein